MTQGRTLSRAWSGNQPLGFDEVTKCAEKQLNTSAGSSPRPRRPSGRLLLGASAPAGGLSSCWGPRPLHGLVPGFSCFSHSRVAPTVPILKAAPPHTDSWEISTGANIHPHASDSRSVERASDDFPPWRTRQIWNIWNPNPQILALWWRFFQWWCHFLFYFMVKSFRHSDHFFCKL